MPDFQVKAPSLVPDFRKVEYADVAVALERGWRDFRRVPILALFLGAVYAVGGLLIFWLLDAYRQPWMIVPIAIGFPLVGPFLAAGTYEISRRIGAGEPLNTGEILGFVLRQGRREFVWMAFVVLFIFWIWMYQARILIALFLDMQAFGSLGALATTLFTTPDGLIMIAIGTVSGGILAMILYTSTVIAMPLLIERDIDVVTALITSWKTVLANPGPMLCLGAAIGGITLVAMAPAFMGLVIVFPVSGFTIWHLYKIIT